MCVSISIYLYIHAINWWLPSVMTIFIILMAPPLARARNSFSSNVAKVTRYKADKSKLKMGGGLKSSETELGK